MAKRKSRTEEYHASNQVYSAVCSLDGWITLHVDKELIFGESDLLYFRWNKDFDRIDFGIRKTFDRWANSLDYACNVVEYDVDKIVELFKVATWAVDSKINIIRDDFETIDLRDLLRRFRKAN